MYACVTVQGALHRYIRLCNCIGSFAHVWVYVHPHIRVTSVSICYAHEHLPVTLSSLFTPKVRKTYRSDCSAHPDSAKVIRVQILVTIEVEARGGKSHAGP